MKSQFAKVVCMVVVGLGPVSWVKAHTGHKLADVEWPAVRSLDALSGEIGYFLQKNDAAAVRGRMLHLKQVIDDAAMGGIPKKVRDPLMARLALDDLQAMGSSLEKMKGADDQTVLSRLRRLQPLVDQLIDDSQASVVQGHGPHDGEFAPVLNGAGKTVLRVELKLHDDKGDLELWLTSADGQKPMDLPLGAEIGVVFLDRQDRKVTLKVRNTIRNEDEEGMPNIRSGKTNYFIFPGDTGVDATWLMGKSFKAMVQVSIAQGEKVLRTVPFGLSPHGGADHSH